MFQDVWMEQLHIVLYRWDDMLVYVGNQQVHVLLVHELQECQMLIKPYLLI